MEKTSRETQEIGKEETSRAFTASQLQAIACISQFSRFNRTVQSPPLEIEDKSNLNTYETAEKKSFHSSLSQLDKSIGGALTNIIHCSFLLLESSSEN
jgi:hypothetical protein